MTIKTQSLCFILILLSLLTACTKKTPTLELENTPEPTITSTVTPTIVPTITPTELTPTIDAADQKAEMISYHLGSTKIKLTNSGLEKEYPITGWMGIPNQSNSPVIFILHGSHLLDTSKETLIKSDYAGGFKYLVQALADQGYLVMSININRSFAWILEDGDEIGEEGNEPELTLSAFYEHLEALKKGNDGNNLFGVDITNKADLSKINFIGHSRGGEAIQMIAKELKKDNDRVISLLQVAPSLNYFDLNEQTDVPTAILLPQYDGDVYHLDGNKYFINAEMNSDRKTPIMTVFLLRGKHSPFNTLASKKQDHDNNDEIEDLLPIKKHQEFLKNFAIEFMNSQNKTKRNMMDLLHPEITETYGSKFSYTIYDPNGLKLIDAPNIQKNGMQSNDLKFEFVTASTKKDRNTAGLFHFPGQDIFDMNFYSIKWKKPNGEVKIPIDLEQKDFSKFNKLSITLALNSTDTEYVSEHEETEIEIILEDNIGTMESVIRSSFYEPALLYHWGRTLPANPDFGFDTNLWSQYTPLGTMLIDMSEFSGINLTEVKNLHIVAKSQKGSIMLQSINLYE